VIPAELLGAALIIVPVMALVVAAGVAMADELGLGAAFVIWLTSSALTACIVAGAWLLGDVQ